MFELILQKSFKLYTKRVKLGKKVKYVPILVALFPKVIDRIIFSIIFFYHIRDVSNLLS